MDESHRNGAAGEPVPGPEVARLSDADVERLVSGAGILEHLSDVIAVLDRQLRYLYLSRTVGERSRDDLLGTSLLDHITDDTRAGFVEAFERAWTEQGVCSVEGASHDDRWWHTRLVPIADAVSTRLMLCMSVEISARKRAEAAARESEGRLRDAMEVTGVGTWAWSRTSDRVSWDAGVCRIWGVDPSAGPLSFETYQSLVHPDDRERVAAHILRAVETGVYDELEHRVLRPSGETRIVSCRATVVHDRDGSVMGMHGAVFDVTERRALEERVRQSHKLEAIGQLTAGIAHNFNNLLTIVLPNVELARPYAGPPAQACLDDIEHAALRAADMVRQLMLFARRESRVTKVRCDLTAILERTIRICRATFDPRIAIELELATELPPIVAAPGEIEQVLLNVCINARDALTSEPPPAPRLVIRASCADGQRVCIEVSDNGPGMDRAVQSRLFEPFFTTKGVGTGTGLGLASAYGIVTEHQGTIRCQSERYVGSTFIIELPVALGAPDEPPRIPSIMPRAGGETLLIVDDEPMVRRALAAVLEGAGYAVRTAQDAVEALMRMETEPRIDLVILDRAMPRGSGDHFLSELRRHDLLTPVLLLTGQPGADGDVLGANAVILKPPATAELLETVRSLLQEVRAT